jgi:transcriptional regulator with XRE-family HTH domain
LKVERYSSRGFIFARTTGMAMKLMANGARIKELRLGGIAELPQKTLAAQCGISERQLRRIENKNAATRLPILKQIAKVLAVTVDDISVGFRGPQLVFPTIAAKDEPETLHIPRQTTAWLAPVASAQNLYELAKSSMEIVPHVLVDARPVQMEMIEECLEILKVISEREWPGNRLVTSDSHDDADFPEVSRRRRLAELFVLIKGHDIRIAAEVQIYEYPPGATPWLEGARTSDHLMIAFAPPRREYEEEKVTVFFDRGRELVLPYKPIAPDTPRCGACGSYFFDSYVDEPDDLVKLRCRTCGWIKDDTVRAHSQN